jgi:hypothetical protein
MTTIEHQIEQLRRAVTDLAAQLSPWITTPEMCKRYDCTPKTLAAMERRGDIPWRVKGRWNRAEVVEWEARQPA